MNLLLHGPVHVCSTSVPLCGRQKLLRRLNDPDRVINFAIGNGRGNTTETHLQKRHQAHQALIGTRRTID